MKTEYFPISPYAFVTNRRAADGSVEYVFDSSPGSSEWYQKIAESLLPLLEFGLFERRLRRIHSDLLSGDTLRRDENLQYLRDLGEDPFDYRVRAMISLVQCDGIAAAYQVDSGRQSRDGLRALLVSLQGLEPGDPLFEACLDPSALRSPFTIDTVLGCRTVFQYRRAEFPPSLLSWIVENPALSSGLPNHLSLLLDAGGMDAVDIYATLILDGLPNGEAAASAALLCETA